MVETHNTCEKLLAHIGLVDPDSRVAVRVLAGYVYLLRYLRATDPTHLNLSVLHISAAHGEIGLVHPLREMYLRIHLLLLITVYSRDPSPYNPMPRSLN